MKKGWETSTLGGTCEMYQPKTISGKEMIENGAYPVFGANGIIGRYDKFNHEERQLLITCRGATCGSVNISEPQSWVTGNAMVVRPKNGLIEMRFLEYLFRGGIDISKAITGAAQPQITRTNLAPLEIRYPTSVPEQQRIVALLDEAFDGLATAQANAEKNLQNARALFESHLQSVFTHRDKGWVATTLGAEIDLLSGFAFKSARYTESEKDVRLLRGDNIIQGSLRWDDVKRWPASDAAEYERYRLCAGDVVLAMDRPWVKAGLKRAQISLDDLPCLLVQRTARLRGNGSLNNRFLVFLISSGAFTRHILGVQTGIGVPHISGQQIKDFSFLKPPVKEQVQIADDLADLATETQRLESLYTQKQAALAELKKSLLHQAFTGAL
jgi:type I restriction enzyme S subunit